MPTHPELAAEQAYIDRAYRSLEAMRDSARRMIASVIGQGRGGTHQAREERDVIVRSSLQRLEQLDIGREALCFGRIDHQETAERFYIGRLAVSGPDHEPMIVDWRAPVAEPFYRATGAQPMGLGLRRHFLTEGPRLLAIEDEVFGEEGLEEATVGGILVSALDRARTGHMRDIVATIQREQDEIIRAPLPGLLVVQGGPGTGKTAVALHRAAYLLYTHRFPLERQGVLVVGPNQLFLRYIDQVLPSLGESGAVLTTLTGLVPEVRATTEDPPALAALKGDQRMARVLNRAVRDRQRPLRSDLEVALGPYVLRVAAAETAQAVAAGRRRHGTHNSRRRFVEAELFRLLYDRYVAAVERSSGPEAGPEANGPRPGGAAAAAPVSAAGGPPGAVGADPPGVPGGGSAADPPGAPPPGPPGLPDAEEAGLAKVIPLFGPNGARGGGRGRRASGEEEDDEVTGVLDEAELRSRLRRHPAVVEALDRMWPRLSAPELLHDLFGARPLLALAGRGTLTDAEVALLHRRRSASPEEIPWSRADLPLVDEAKVLLGPARGRPTQEELDWPRTYGHIVVDEAQDLSAMQLRMLSRRSISGSMTVVGDVAQATGAQAHAGWEEVARHLAPKRPPTVTELTVNYRTPADIMDVAAGVLAAAEPDLVPPRSVRSTGVPPRAVAAPAGNLPVDVARVALEELTAVDGGNVAVICADSWADRLGGQLPAHGLGQDGILGLTERDGLDRPVTLVPVGVVKGLEFDAVVVVEPAAILEEAAQGMRALYVALTRATRRLAIVHARPLPDVLEGALSGSRV